MSDQAIPRNYGNYWMSYTAFWDTQTQWSSGFVQHILTYLVCHPSVKKQKLHLHLLI